MTFGLVDLLLIALVALFVISGLYYGFIHTFGNLVGMILGILVGGYALLWLDQEFQLFSSPIFAIVVYLLLILLISRLVGWLVELLDRLYKIVSIIPYLTSINRLLGGIFGFVEGMMMVAAVIYFTTTFMPKSDVTAQILVSPTATWLTWTVEIVKWLFPKVVG